MKLRVRPVKNLFHRWGLLVSAGPELCAEALERDGLIELSADRTHYVETPKARNLSPEVFEKTMLGSIIKYQTENKESDNGNK